MNSRTIRNVPGVVILCFLWVCFFKFQSKENWPLSSEVITAAVRRFFKRFLPILHKPWKQYEWKHQMFPGLHGIPKLERVLERSMMACLLGLLRTERLAREMSAVTRVIDILKEEKKKKTPNNSELWAGLDMGQKHKQNQLWAVDKSTFTDTNLPVTILRVNAVSGSFTKPTVWEELYRFSLKACLRHHALKGDENRILWILSSCWWSK